MSVSDVVEDRPAVDDGAVFEFPAALLPVAEASVEKANRRLARGGSAERFTFTVERIVKSVTVEQIAALVEFVRLTLSAPRLRAAGHTFVATLVQEPGGMVVRCAPGQSLDGWTRPADHWCDYCRTRRTRSTSYVVRDEATGEFWQIGKNCVAPFLGVQPSGLWALTFSLDGELPEPEEWLAGEGGQRLRQARLFDVRELLAMAWAVSREGRKFVTATAARESDGQVQATAWEALEVLTWTPIGRVSAEYQAYVYGMRAAAAAVPAAVVDELVGYVDTLDPETDYGQNMQTAVAGGLVSWKSVGLVVSLIAVRRRAVEQKDRDDARREREAAIVDEWLGEIKGKLTGLTVTVTHAFEVAGYHDGVDTIAVMQTDCGHVLKWKASGEHDELEAGRRFTVDRATVKDHAEYRGVKQTVVTRCKLTELADRAD